MMLELARLLEKHRLVQLGRVAAITGISENYLAQLAIPLKNNGLILGVSGKKGGYQLAKPATEISIGEIIQAVSGPLTITDCVDHPEICLNSSFCEARAVWVLVSSNITDVLNRYSLDQMIKRDWLGNLRGNFPELALLNPDMVLASNNEESSPGCPGSMNNISKGD